MKPATYSSGRGNAALLVPLFVAPSGADIAVAMESRCYHGGEGRTKMKQLTMKRGDYVGLTTGALLLTCVITLASFGL